MSRAFFGSVVEAIPAFVPKEYRGFELRVSAAGCKVWFVSWHEHYEVQRVPAAVMRAAKEGSRAALEVGMHLEHPRADHNDAALDVLHAKERTWRRALGREPVAGRFVGRAEQRARWRRISELWQDDDVDEEGLAMEAAERLARYIVALQPLLNRPPPGRCHCWVNLEKQKSDA
ncbi:MAG: hypothetical protein ABR552_10345 [Actinomycetota bacterium]